MLMESSRVAQDDKHDAALTGSDDAKAGNVEETKKGVLAVALNEESEMVECTLENQLCRLCSRHLVEFSVHICKAHPVTNVVLTEIAKDCWCITKPVCKMDNKNKRFLLHWCGAPQMCAW